MSNGRRLEIKDQLVRVVIYCSEEVEYDVDHEYLCDGTGWDGIVCGEIGWMGWMGWGEVEGMGWDEMGG